jgi:hypothetical protein
MSDTKVIQWQIKPCIKSQEGTVVSKKSYTVTEKEYGAIVDTEKKCTELAKWQVLSPEEALKIVEGAAENIVNQK